MQQIVVICLVILLILRRMRRSVGFQKYNQTTLAVRMVLFTIIALFILYYDFVKGGNGNSISPIPESIGILLGLLLAYTATNHAQFEKREDGLYYKTHIWVEVTVIILFLGRFFYRILILKDIRISDQTSQDAQMRMQAMRDPITRSILFIFCTYYIGYFSFILKEGRKAING